ncbi:hypothetical protein KOW79_005238 [Hemibagrus wyckioides]|uniref:G-protein coupled receptors family 1 profile domain-containing protein n=2 Tax=Hemibagrus wyckioides TaxID=337641 RepID=A0A9D3NZ80_9TELE|nr:hypothetical protein KOW79_005238 [Hemibagrus wyckioides]
MLSLLCMPFTAVTVASTDWSFGVGFCRASVMLYWFFVLEGVSILLIISVDRFLIIVQRQDKLTPHRAKVLIASSWALSFCVALPSLISWRTGIIMERMPQCILGYSDSLAERGYMVLLAVAVFFVPFSVMLYSYMCILNTVRRNALRIHTHVAEDCAGLKLGLTGLQRPPQVNVDMSFKTRAFTTILILFIGFSVCWLPHTVVSLMAVFSRSFYFSPAFYPVSIGALWLSYLKAVFNPVIYCWRIRKFREACLDFMPKTCRLCPKVPGRSHRRIRPSNIYICSMEMASCSKRGDVRMRNSDGDVSGTDLLLHPELLSRDFLKLVLHEKKIKTDESEDPDHLTELYIQHVIPLPQRELPNNRWGKRVEKTNPRQSSTTAHSSSTDSGRKRPLIVFDGSSTNTGSIKLKRAEDVPVTDRLKSPPSSISLNNPIRKLPGSSPNSSSSRASAGSARSPTGNGSLISSSASPVQSNCMSTKLKRGASSSGVPKSPELKSPEVKKKIQHVTWP